MSLHVTTTIKHSTLNATLHGVLRRGGADVLQFRGIKYGHVPARFTAPIAVDDWAGANVDCKEYGPRCPQQAFDVGYLLRLPEDVELPREREDEFECLNLDISMPASEARVGERKREGLLPVMVWIHDTCKIVETSVKESKPVIVVAMQYRLNIFAFGDGKGPRNLALKDQRLAIDWVKKHIAGFGGDPENITVAGESAGAVYAHAQVVGNAPVKRAILMSGTLEMSPPRPLSNEATIVAPIEAKLARIGSSLRTATAEQIIEALTEANMVSMWLQQSPDEPELSEWTRTGNASSLLIGDVEYESILWRNGIEALTPQMIVDAFNLAGEHSGELRRAYNITGSRATPSKTGALDFINDTRFSWPIRKLSRAWRAGGLPVYGYAVDQANPWQASSRAHHAVDLVLLFGGLDLSFNPAAAAVGDEMRRRWIAFVNGEAPWSADTTFAFGPHGISREVDAGGLAARRRTAQMETLERVEPAQLGAVFAALAAGRVSLLN
ncbi:hypothetical protein BFW01_g12225 [Lasiodiplodia theobromae]|nr:hypothetical protein BFW01_g12225 [Lasiodiplodia theobromae]